MPSKSDLKKQLKAEIKTLRDAGYHKHINLAIASVEELQQFLNEAQGWTPAPLEPETETEPQKIPTDSALAAIAIAQTLKQLGQAICQLSGKGNWKDWQLSYWDKNGECRIYLKDISYTNPKDRGYLEIRPDGSILRFWKGRDDFPPLPSLPSVMNDLVAQPFPLTPEERAVANLNAQFGNNGWTQSDLDDELEREEYQ